MSFSALICSWYAENKRDLPWRNNVTPYSTWISEVILQQTRVSQGLPYYYKFIEAFPTVIDLAQAEEDTVLKLWQGLGYYSRARNMQKTAQIITRDYAGIFPSKYEQLIQLKGIGPYTAAAIASICTDEKVAVVDGNVYRVLSRYFNIHTPIESTEGKKHFNLLANELLEALPSSVHNQAIMELGALVCSPKKPNCDACPLHSSCESFHLKNTESLPQKSKKTKVRNRYFNYLILKDNQQNTLLSKRGEKDIWQGLYEFPLLESETEEFNPNHLALFLKTNLSIEIPIKTIVKAPFETKHKLSHQTIFAKFYVISLDSELKLNNSIFLKIEHSEIQNYPLPQLIQNYLNN